MERQLLSGECLSTNPSGSRRECLKEGFEHFANGKDNPSPNYSRGGGRSGATYEKSGPSAFPVQVSTSFSDLQEFGSKIIGPHIATERPSAPVRPYAPGMRKNRKRPQCCRWSPALPAMP
jgi:hypothetical protein